jgi:hypothetical protein
MAIFKLGKRIGPFDISGGLSRGDLAASAYHKTDNDPRIKQRANTDNTIGRFRSAINAGEGFARPSRFAIRIFPPVNLEKQINNGQLSTYNNGEVNISGFKTQRTIDRMGGDGVDGKYMNDLNSSYGRQVNINCDNITMPTKKMVTQAVQYGSEPTRDMVVGHEFPGTIVASFYADKYMRERQFFEAWMKMCVGEHTHKANYYDDYIGKMHIFQLGADSEIGRDMPTYAVEAMEVYPTELGSIEYGYGKKNEVVKINMEFGYKYWRNMSDTTSSRQFAQHMQSPAEVKSANNGLFGMLPPELQRIGKSVLGQARTVLNPTGRITKGRIFGPFF